MAMTPEEREAAEWLANELEGYMAFDARPKRPDWKQYETHRRTLLGENWENQKAPQTQKVVWQKCQHCNGTGAIGMAHSGSDPSCPECDGVGSIAEGA